MKTEIAEHEQAKIDALEFIASLGITAQIKANGVAESKEDKPWLHFRWNCTVKRERRLNGDEVNRSTNFDDYKTGVGVKAPPDIADILGSYARDYVDANNAGSFEDWASDLGYDTDSRKAEETYRACLAQRKPLIALGLSMAEIEKIAEYASQF